MNTITLPRPVRRPRARRARATRYELTPTGVQTAAASAALALERAEAQYSDLAASAQEGASILPEVWNAVGDRYHRAACLVELCAVLLDAPELGQYDRAA